MNNDYTYIAEVLDRSGSMSSIAEGTIAGHNEFLAGQQAAPGKCYYLLAQFDNEYEIVHDGPIATAKPLDRMTYVPRGSTALLDAIGRTINAVGARLEAMSEADRPGKVLVVILTDGEENASSTYNRGEILALVQQQRTVYNWQFVFLAANQDAIKEGRKFGISPDNAMTFTASPQNARNTYSMMTNKVANLRAASAGNVSQAMTWTDQERKLAAEPEKK